MLQNSVKAGFVIALNVALLVGATVPKTVTYGPFSGQIIRVGTPLSLDRNTGVIRAAVPQLRNTAELFTSWLNRVRGGVNVNGTKHLLSVTLVDDKGTTAGVTDAAKHLVQNLSINIWLGPATSTLNGPAAEVANSSGVVMVTANAASPSVFRGRPNVFGVLTPAPLWPKPALDALAAKGMKTIGYMYENVGFQRALCMAVPSFAAGLGVNVTKVIEGPASFTQGFNAAVLEMKTAAPDVVLVCAYEAASKLILQSMRSNNFVPKMIVFGAALTAWDPNSESDIRFAAGLELWSKDAPLRSAWSGMTAASFAQSYSDDFGASPTWFGSTAWVALEVLVQAIERANSSNADAIAAELKATDVQTLYGQVKFDGNNQNVGECKVIQYSASSVQPIFVAPMNTGNFSYPLPPWDERKCLAVQPVGSIYGYSTGGSCVACTDVALFNVSSQRRHCKVCPLGEEAVNSQVMGPNGQWQPTRSCNKKCPTGSVLNNSGLCQQCGAGYIAFQGSCTFCRQGTSNAQIGQTDCGFCFPGSFANTTGQSSCRDCPPGKISESLGATSCKDCVEGKFQPMWRATNCSRCQIGKFAFGEANILCTACTTGFVTAFIGAYTASDCVCPKGTYADAVGAACIKCPEGMTCVVGSALTSLGSTDPGAVAPALKPGYWSSPASPLSVYKCQDDEVCPGGSPGTCGKAMTGRMCGECITDYRRSGNTCIKCLDFETSPMLFPILPLALGPAVVWLLYKCSRDEAEKWGSWRNGLAALGLLLLNHYQCIQLIGETDVPIADPLPGFYDAFSFSTDAVSLFSPQCSVLVSFRISFIVRVLAPLIVCLIFLEAYLLLLPLRCAGRSGLTMDIEALSNIYFGVLYAFYIGIVKLSMSLFVCNDHPNRKATMRSAPSVHCGEAEWTEMLGIAIPALFLFCFCPLCLFIYVIYVAPAKFHLKSFRRRWKFILMKYRPDVWWWGMVFLAKGLAVNFGMLFRSAFGQLFSVFLSMSCYFMLTVSFKPWRHRAASIMEVIATTSVLVACFLALANASFVSERDTTSLCAILFSSMPLAVAAPLLGGGLILKGSRHVEEFNLHRIRILHEHILHSAQAFERRAGKENMEMLMTLPFADRDVLGKAADVLLSELLGEQPRASRFRQRLITRSESYSTRKSTSLSLDHGFPVSKTLSALSSGKGGPSPISVSDAEAMESPVPVTGLIYAPQFPETTKGNNAQTEDVDEFGKLPDLVLSEQLQILQDDKERLRLSLMREREFSEAVTDIFTAEVKKISPPQCTHQTQLTAPSTPRTPRVDTPRMVTPRDRAVTPR